MRCKALLNKMHILGHFFLRTFCLLKIVCREANCFNWKKSNWTCSLSAHPRLLKELRSWLARKWWIIFISCFKLMEKKTTDISNEQGREGIWASLTKFPLDISSTLHRIGFFVLLGEAFFYREPGYTRNDMIPLVWATHKIIYILPLLSCLSWHSCIRMSPYRRRTIDNFLQYLCVVFPISEGALRCYIETCRTRRIFQNSWSCLITFSSLCSPLWQFFSAPMKSLQFRPGLMFVLLTDKTVQLLLACILVGATEQLGRDYDGRGAIIIPYPANFMSICLT